MASVLLGRIQSGIVVLEIGAWNEKHFRKLVDKLILIDAEKAHCLARIDDKPDYLKDILEFQHLPPEYDLKILNNGTVSDLELKVDAVWNELIQT